MDTNQHYNQGDHGHPMSNQGQKKKKCHGNRRDQRFRKKCRKRGMDKEKTKRLLETKKKIHIKKNNQTVNITSSTSNNNNILPMRTKNETIRKDNQPLISRRNLKKRKRDISLQQLNLALTMPKSISSISILQPLQKKTNNKKEMKLSSPSVKVNDRIINTKYLSLLL